MSLLDDKNGDGALPLPGHPSGDSGSAVPPQMQMQLLSALMERPAGEPPSIDFGAFSRAVLRFWPVLAVAVVLGLGAAWFYLKRTPVLYVAIAEIGVGQERSELLPSAGASGEDLKSLEMLKSIERQIAGQNVLLEVARRFKLHNDPVLAGKRAAGGLNDDEVVVALSRRVTASLERGTRNIVLSVEDTEPQRAKDICDTILDLVVQRDPGAANAIKEKAVAALEEQVNTARKRIDTAQEAVNRFRAKYPALPLEENPSDLKTNSFEDRLKVLNTDAALKAEDELNSLKVLVDRIDAAGSDLNALLAVPGLATQEAAIAQRNILGAAQAKFAETDYDYKHPTYKAMQQQISEISEGLRNVLLTAARVERVRYDKAKGNVERIKSQIASLKAQQNSFAAVAGEFQKLTRELKAAREAFSVVVGRLNEETANSSFGASALSVVASPLTPSWPWKPRPTLIMGAGGAVGIGGGLFIIAVLMLADRSIRSLASGERILRMPGLAAMPLARLSGAGSWLTYGNGRDHSSAEAFRGLRAALGTGRAPAARSFLFTSACGGEGKSYVALNFAASLAQQGYRTLVIDANLRAPVIDEVFLGERSQNGLADYLAGECSQDAKLCQQTGVANLFVFSAGIPRAHPGEILNEPAFARLLQESLKWFHRVVIDTPAAGQYADALPLARHAGAVCLVVRPGLTKRADALKTVRRLAAAGGRPTGFVLNAAPDQAVREGFAGETAGLFRSAPALPPAGAHA